MCLLLKDKPQILSLKECVRRNYHVVTSYIFRVSEVGSRDSKYVQHVVQLLCQDLKIGLHLLANKVLHNRIRPMLVTTDLESSNLVL